MPAGQIIGRVSVKVLPDVDGFRKEALRKLEQIEKRLKFVVPTTLDITGAKRDMLKVLRELNAENKSMDSRKVRFYAKISTDGLRGELQRFRREATALAKTQPIKLGAQLVAANATLELDTDSLKHVKRQLDRWREGVDPLKIQVKLELGEVSVMATRVRLAVLSRDRFVTLIPRVNKVAAAKAGAVLAALSGARMLSSTFENIWDMFKNLDKMIPLIAAVGNAVGLLGASLLTASSNAFALLSSLASIGYLGLALPGILGAFAVGLGVTAAAFMTFGDNVPDVRKALTDLKETIGKDFWKEAADPIREMANELMPRLGKSAKVMGTYFGGLFSALGTTFKTTLIPMFRDFNESVKIATGGTDGLAGVITKLGVLGAGYLPRLAMWFVKITDQFDTFLAKAGADGRLQSWVDAGVVALKDLGRVLMGTFDIFADMGRAAQAAGGSTLGILADTLERIHKTTSGKVFQTGMADAFRAAHEMISIIADKSGPAISKFFTTFSKTLTVLLPIVGETLGTAFDALADAMSQPGFQTGLIAMFEGIRKGVEGLAPVMPALGRAFGKLGELIGTLAESFGPLLAKALQIIVDVFLKLEPALTPLIPILGDALLGIMESLAPALVAVAEALAPVLVAFGDALAGALPQLVPLLDELAKSAGTLLVEALKAVTPMIAPLVQGLTDFLVALTPLLPDLTELALLFIPILPRLMELAIVALPMATDALKALGAVIGPVIWLIKTLGGGFDKIKASIPAAAFYLVARVAAAWVDLKGRTQAAWDRIVGIATGVWPRIAAAVVAGIAAVVLQMHGLPGQITGAVGDLGSLLWNAGASVMQGFIEGLMPGIRVVQGILETLTASIPGWKGPASTDKLLLFNAGQLVIDGFINGLESRYDAVRESLSGLTLDIASTSIQPPSVGVVGVNAPAVSGPASAAYAAPGGTSAGGVTNNITVPMMPTNSTPEDVADALLFAVRRITHGGVYAQEG